VTGELRDVSLRIGVSSFPVLVTLMTPTVNQESQIRGFTSRARGNNFDQGSLACCKAVKGFSNYESSSDTQLPNHPEAEVVVMVGRVIPVAFG